VTDIFKNGGGKKMAEDMGVPFLGNIPIESQIVASGDSGSPFHNKTEHNTTVARKKFTSIVETIIKGAKK
jgi:ATP-binding protein involved in chromosome partitioning